MSDRASQPKLAQLTITVALTISLLGVDGCTAGRNMESTPAPSALPIVTAAVTKHVGLAVYPGARPTSNGIREKNSAGREVYAGYYRTVDPLPKVKDFYLAHTPRGSLKMYVFESNSGTADFAFVSGGTERQVVLASDSGGTLIALSAVSRAP